MEKYYIIRNVNCGCIDGKTGKMYSDIVGITTDLKYAKSQQSVFRSYEEVKLIIQPTIK